MRNTLVIFTHGSPFVNGENAFLLPEIQPLAARFQRVILVPTFIPAHPVMPMLPSNVEVYKKATEANTKRVSLTKRPMIKTFLNLLKNA